MLLYKGKYQNFFSFALMIQKFSKESVKRNIRNFCFSGFASLLLKYNFFKLGSRKFHFSKYKKHFKSGVFSLFKPRSKFLKHKKFFRFSVFWNIKKFHFGVSVYRNTTKAIFWENMRNFLILEPKFHFLKYKEFF